MPVGAGGAVKRAPVAEAWTCPNCDVENVSILAQGCPACGAGVPGQKAPPPVVPTEVGQAFEAWFRPLVGQASTAEVELMRQAFEAGWKMAAIATPAPTPPKAEEALIGTPETRTLRAALAFFIDNVLDANPEEVTSGEWLPAELARKLLTTIG
jgi:hypothetical protein